VRASFPFVPHGFIYLAPLMLDLVL
jgi:hypothetical protein